MKVNLPYLKIDADIEITDKGVNVSVKKFDINNFSIDKVFKHFDKKYGKKKDKDKIEVIEDNSSNDEYLIEIE